MNVSINYLDSTATIENSDISRELKHLLEADDVLAEFEKSLINQGYYGQERNAKLLFLCLCTWRFETLVSVIVKGASAGGKSSLVQQVLRFFPTSRYYAMTGMSEKALYRWDEPIANRFLVFYELHGISRTTGAYLLRSLLSEGEVRYTVNVPHATEGWKPKEFVKSGPTGIILTTTELGLHPEDETRVLALEIDDSPEQIARVLAAKACEKKSTPDLTVWHELDLLISALKLEVVVPFGPTLAKLIPPLSSRLTRDFVRVLSLICAHALIHFKHRERDDRGRVVASLEDYSAVRNLLNDILGQAVNTKVSEDIRNLVEKVAELNKTSGVTNADLVEVLGVKPYQITRMVKRAIHQGYLTNDEPNSGKPNRLFTSNPLPEDKELLPDPKILADALLNRH